MGRVLEWRLGAGSPYQKTLPAHHSAATAGAVPSPTRADNRIFNDYDYHLNNWKLPQIIKMRFGSSSPISPLSFKSDGNFAEHLETRATEKHVLAERRLEVNVDADAYWDERHMCVHVCT